MHRSENIGIPEHKKFLRDHFRAVRRELPSETKGELDRALVENAEATPEFQNSDTLLIYYPTKEEPNLLRLAEIALSTGKRVAFPVTQVKERTLIFRQIRSLEDIYNMQQGAYGICEPSPLCPQIKEFAKAFCVVPALSYDNKGNRLGYGGGYYDRFLRDFSGVSAILIYSCLYSEQIPTDRFDVKADIIINEKGGAVRNE